MNRSLDDKIYQPKVIKCGSCHLTLGTTAADNQILILESGLIAFSWFSWQCPCGKNDSWLAPTLPDEVPTLDNQFPDVKELEKRTKGITKLAFDRYRVRIRSADGKEKYVGVFPDEQTAIRERNAAVSLEKAKKFGYQFKQKQTDEHLHADSQTA